MRLKKVGKIKISLDDRLDDILIDQIEATLKGHDYIYEKKGITPFFEYEIFERFSKYDSMEDKDGE